MSRLQNSSQWSLSRLFIILVRVHGCCKRDRFQSLVVRREQTAVVDQRSPLSFI